ncbi:MAG: cysteine hydrolase, partial [bacterium]|nr:cysteine hydrolase [bacterium]
MKKKILMGLLAVVISIVVYLYMGFKDFSVVSKGKPIAEYDNPQKALLVIDVQREFTEKTGKAPGNLKQTDQIIENINKILEKNEALKLNIVYITQEFKDEVIIKLITGGAAQHGAPGADMDPRVKKVSDTHFVKHIMDSFSNPGLDKYLIANKINHIYITGLDAEACVDKTTKAALNRKYKVTVVKDAIATGSEEKREKKLKEFAEKKAEIITTAKLIEN